MESSPSNSPAVRPPDRRLLRAFAFDPMSTRLTGRFFTVDVPFEPGLLPGPNGALVQVVDFDGSRGVWYQPVDLNDPAILAVGGLQPVEGDPRTHQQVVYAVAMSVIERFERFGGRRFRWHSSEKLRLVPHAFEGSNAYFDPSRRAVLFGYYRADAVNPGANLPEQMMFTCLSVDIVAHEVTHAIVHRLRRYFSEPTNRDVFAWHEAFADLVALFHHFVFRDAVARAIASSGGDLGVEKGAALLELAREFGMSTGRGAALRSAIGSPRTPDAFLNATEAHARGACFVAAVFDAYLDSYQSIIADLRRLATGGSGIIPPGALSPDLVNRLTTEALKNADRVLGMVVRAFEYMPVVDVTFGDVVQAIVTADRSLFPDDAMQLRATLVEALRRRGIVPSGVSSLAEEALSWNPPPVGLSLTDKTAHVDLAELILNATQDLDVNGTPSPANAVTDDPEADNAETFTSMPGGTRNPMWADLHTWGAAHALELGLDPHPEVPLAVVGAHVVYLQASDGQPRPIVVVQFMQRRRDLEDQTIKADQRVAIRAGTTVIARVDGQVDYVVSKPLPLKEPFLLGAITDSNIRKFAEASNDLGRKRLTELAEWIDEVDAFDPLAIWTDAPAVNRLTFAQLHADEL